MTVAWPDYNEDGDHEPQFDFPEARVVTGVAPPPSWHGKWDRLAAWCRAHPGEVIEIPGIYVNGPYVLRRRHPDLTVRSYRHRWEGPDGQVRRGATPRRDLPDGEEWHKVCDTRVSYEPEES